MLEFEQLVKIHFADSGSKADVVANLDAARTWVLAQHEYTMARLTSLPAREGIRRRLEELMRTPAMGTITKAGKRYFFRQRFEDQELSALYCQDAPHGAPRRSVP